MSILQNMEYNKILSSLTIGATLASPMMADNINYELSRLSYKAPYDKSINYSSYKQSTFDDSLLKNDIEMIKLLELSNIINTIENRYDTKVIHTWIPAEGSLDKVCLFVSVQDQNDIKLKYEDFELDLFLTLEKDLKQSQLFNMIALM